MENVAKLIRRIVYILSGIAIAALTVMSVVSTSFVAQDASGAGRIFYERDYPLLHIVLLMLPVGFVYWLRRQQISREQSRKLMKIMLIVWTGIALFWVLSYQLPPDINSDSRHILDAASKMRRFDFSSFTEGGYLYRWKNNRGITLILYLLSYLIGVDNYDALRILNVAAILLIYWLLNKASDLLWGGTWDAEVSLLQTGCFCMFLPLILYATFIYGDWYALSFAVAGLYGELKYFKDRKYRWMILSAVCIGMAAFLKSNEMIALIAMLVLILYDVLLTGQWQAGLLYLMLVTGAAAGINGAKEIALSHITHLEMTDAAPVESWIAMGLQDTDGGSGAGTYNGYNLQSFAQNNFDVEATKASDIANIKESLTNFKNHPGYALNFFTRKIAGQWNMPDMQAATEIVKGDDVSCLVKAVCSEKGAGVIRFLMNILQTWILVGALCYLLLDKDRTEYEWVFLLVFLGGFLFHLFWEACGRYAAPYYVMLIPYGAKGIVAAEKRIEAAVFAVRHSGHTQLLYSLKQKKQEQQEQQKHQKQLEADEPAVNHAAGTWKKQLIVGMLILAASAALPFAPIWKTIGLISDAKPAMQEERLKSGFYYIGAGTDGDLYLSQLNDQILVLNQKTDAQLFSIYASDDKYILRFQEDQRALSVTLLPDEGDVLMPSTDEHPSEWTIQFLDDAHERCTILRGESALVYNSSDWTVRLADYVEGDESQIFRITKAWND